MPDAHILHEITKALRALQIRAVAAESPLAEATIAKALEDVRVLALKADMGDKSPPTTVAEMMRRLGDHSTGS